MKCAIVLNTPMLQATDGRQQDEDVPRRDYLLLAECLNAQVISPNPPSKGGVLGHHWASLLAVAWRTFRRRDEYDVVLTMSEQVGLPLALLFKLARCKKTHIMINHYVTPARKGIFLRLFHVGSHITKFICYGTVQASFLTEELGIPPEKVELVLHPADPHFWQPMPVPAEGVIVSAGNSGRDYKTLLKAVRALDVDVVIAAFSPWVKWRQGQPAERMPDRVRSVRCTSSELRKLYARSQFVVVPLVPMNGQSGSLVIYEAMSMGKAVITTANGGNVDIVREGETGYYVPPGDHQALRQAITRLLDDPAMAQRMGARARKIVEEGLNLDSYIHDVTRIIQETYRQGRTIKAQRQASKTRAHDPSQLTPGEAE